ncbi:hypothetical protein SAMN05421771_0442 [Granulicella pectinivorans]|jgi:hypothetical protein|uniref:Uncharacterized protein n=1 Tax=Granulicella pectinivorans TaxID=474950 RepID=A0A1I6L975_9BACT|nr:hypothetical protein [Granulicella pectinivorans]SFS00031.1 hypothetical protein SAMN05421771_0442 [Granulicella pectinivorans]
MFTPSTVQLWLSEQATPLMIIVGVLVAGFLLLKFSAARRKAALLRERAGHTEDSFVEHLTTFGFDPIIARSTYRYLQEKQNVHFPIFLTDHLDEDLGLGLGDLEQTKVALAFESGREFRPGVRHEPLITVEDLIRLIQASPRKREMVA